MQARIIAGCPASGKSTRAKEWVELGFVEANRDSIRFSVIDPDGDWSTYRFSKKNEKEVTRIWWEKVRNCSFSGDNIVISDTLCNKDKRQNLIDELKLLGYTVIVEILNPPLEELIRRDSLRNGFSVGKDVIERMYFELNKGEINATKY